VCPGLPQAAFEDARKADYASFEAQAKKVVQDVEANLLARYGQAFQSRLKVRRDCLG
jgi:hypothetical protein